MGKGKRSVALFEVIQASKKPRPSFALRVPKWWVNRPEKPAVSEPAHAPAAAVATTPGIDMKVDSEHQRITFHVSYTSAIIAAFAVIVVVALAYIVGSHIKSGPSRALAGPSTLQIRK